MKQNKNMSNLMEFFLTYTDSEIDFDKVAAVYGYEEAERIGRWRTFIKK